MQYWKWDKEKKILKDGRGDKSKEEQGKERKQRKGKDNGEREENNKKQKRNEWKVRFGNVVELRNKENFERI